MTAAAAFTMRTTCCSGASGGTALLAAVAVGMSIRASFASVLFAVGVEFLSAGGRHLF